MKCCEGWDLFQNNPKAREKRNGQGCRRGKSEHVLMIIVAGQWGQGVVVVLSDQAYIGNLPQKKKKKKEEGEKESKKGKEGKEREEGEKEEENEGMRQRGKERERRGE